LLQEFPVLIVRVIVVWLVAQFALAASENTVYPYQIDESIVAAKDYKTFIIASHNLGKPSRQYLNDYEQRVDGYVIKYLKKQGFKVLDDNIYSQALSVSEAQFGDPFDPSSGKIDMAKKQQVLADVFRQLRESQPSLDAVIFTELIDREVYFNTGLKRVARWDGVSRPPLMQGPGQGVPTDFNWAQAVDAVSIGIYIFTIEGQRMFIGVGGMSMTEAIDTKGTPRFKRYRNVLSNKSQIREGIELAFHPFIPMKKYPGAK
jgi:hypothetical protein